MQNLGTENKKNLIKNERPTEMKTPYVHGMEDSIVKMVILPTNDLQIHCNFYQNRGAFFCRN